MAGLYEQMVEDATSFVDASYDEGFKLSPEQRDAIHLAGIRRRFTTLRHSVKALDRLATEQGINDINSLDGVVPLFLPHTAYKSYPLSFLERNRFDALTRWLDGLTAIDLSGVDLSGIDSIDDWLRRLGETTGLKAKIGKAPVREKEGQ